MNLLERKPAGRLALFIAVLLSNCSGGGGGESDAGLSADVPADVPAVVCTREVEVRVNGEVHPVDIATLATQTVVIGGGEVQAIPLAGMIADDLLAPWSFDGKLSPDRVRMLFDYEVAPAEGSGAFLAPEVLARAWYVPDSGGIAFADAEPGPVDGLPACLRTVSLHRRFVVRREAASATVHLPDVASAAVTIETPAGPESAPPLSAFVETSGILGTDPFDAFDFVLIPPDRPDGVRFPYGHNHFESMHWSEAGQRTRSTDTTGDLEAPDGTKKYGGVASEGWSTVKALLYIDLVPRPDPAATVSVPGLGAYTDPASCLGCHVTGKNLVVPVSCSQCHPT